MAWSCTLDTGGLGDEAPPVAKGEVPQKAGDAICDLYFKCGCEDLDTNPYTSEDQCAADIAAGVRAQVDEGEAAELEYDAQCAGRIIEGLEDVVCGTATEQGLDGLIALGEKLQCKLFFGEAEAGESCSELQLSDGDSCVRDATCVDGTCEAIEVPPEPGDACDPQTQLCSGGAYCLDVDQVGSNTCEILPGKSETCLGVGDVCGEGFTCKQTTKTCTEAPANGEQCASTPFPCAVGLYCHPSNKCIALPPVGEACADVEPGAPRCAVGLTCEEDVCVRESALVCSLGPAIFTPLP